ncbi:MULTISPECIES: hypothetical protein [Enterococcus]|uniref:hypothetical protein n=1 Tax=Enterococcus TaxID=1350 RepID=UPI000BB01784|nr:hypothetical protein [Enterococcus thailandicus]ASZ07123.1 hypothetical protein CK496_04115 [Enterococcus thailandicus]
MYYVNGDYTFNNYQGTYIPEIEDTMNVDEFENYIDDLIDESDQVIPNLMQIASNDPENYIRVKDGGALLLIEETCPYCWAYDSVTVEKEYFELAEVEWEEDAGICLECGEKCTVGENAQGYIKIVSCGEDSYYYDLIQKDD